MYAVFDVETTGLCDRDRVVEVAIAHVDADGDVTDRWATLVNPQRDLGPQQLHGIRSADVRKAPTFDQIAGDIRDRLAGRVPVAHNIHFDARLLRSEYRRMGVDIPDLSEVGLCTMSWASHFLPGAGRGLDECCRAAGIVNDRPHEAMSDVLATAELLALYIGSTAAVPPWEGLGVLARGVRWPELRAGLADPVLRGAGGDGADFVSRLVGRLPRVPDPSQAERYLAVLDRALVDRHISATEADQLVDLAAELGITRHTALALHRRYLGALASAARSDGVVSDVERADLDRVATLLSLPPEEVPHAIDRASSASPPAAARPALAPGDIVVLTGSFPESKEHWADRFRLAGMRVAPNVTKRTALVVAADPDSMSGKATKARRYGIPVVGVESVELVLARLDRSTQPRGHVSMLSDRRQ